MPIGFLPKEVEKALDGTADIPSPLALAVQNPGVNLLDRVLPVFGQLAEEVCQIMGVGVVCATTNFEVGLQKHLRKIQRNNLPSDIPTQSARVLLDVSVGVVHLEVVEHSF